MSSDIELYKKKFKENIGRLVEQNRLDEAKGLLGEYENVVKDDIEVYSIKGIIAMMEGEMDEAEKVLKKGLELQLFNFDILYNLAYLYEVNEKYITSYRYYNKALKVSDEKYANNINDKLDELEKINKVKKYVGRKKVVFIAHIFPPVGGSGVQRSLKFVKYLRNFGWEPIIITVGNTRYPLKDETMLSEIPEEVEVIRINERNNIDVSYANKLIQIYSGVINDNILMQEYIKELNKSEQTMNQLLCIPDIYILWATEVLDKIHDKVDFREIDMIYTTAGPYSDHIIGYYLKQKYNKPWVADFRDEWTNNPMANYNKKSIIYKMNFCLEKNIVNYSDRIITVTELASKNYIKNFKLDTKKVITLTNGFDEEDFENINAYSNLNNKKFTIMHNGILYGNRSPITFVTAIKNLIDKRQIDLDKIVAYFTHTDNDEEYKKYVESIGLHKNVKFIGYLNHRESLKFTNKANLLLLITGEGKVWKSVYTGKIFEYLRLNKSILSLSPKGSLVEKLIDETNRGKNVEFNDVKGIEKYILKMYRKWENNELPILDIDDNIKRYERKNLTKKLSATFNDQLESKVLELKKKFKYNKMILTEIDNYIKNNDFTLAETAILKNINTDKKNFELLYMLANLYLDMKNYYLAYKFYNMAIKECEYQYIKEKIENIINLIMQNNMDSIEEFQRFKKYTFIICGENIDSEHINLLEQIGNIEGCINNHSNNIYKKVELNKLYTIKYDYIIVLEKDQKISKKTVNNLISYNINPNKIFNFYSYSYPYFIEGFETKINEFLKKQKVELLITGLSYAEVGVDCDKLSVSSFNFALSGQDIFYDYYLTKYLLRFNSLKKNVKKICINMGYYAFDSDLSLSDNAFTRIHRYFYALGETHSYDNILHLKLCHSVYKSKNYEKDYLDYHRVKLNTVLKNRDQQQEEIAKKQANMNYPETVIENKYIFEMYLKMLNEKNIKPIIIILPTSRYYYKYFSNNYQKNKFYKIINEFRKTYKFEVIDYFNSKMFNDNDFWDYSHLNKKGALKFTNILEKKLSNLED